jgi:molybdopterin synthase catalytic subunit
MRRDWVAATGLSGTSGGYTEIVEPAEPVSQGPASTEPSVPGRHALSPEPLDPLAIAGSVTSDAKGALTTFIGLVRDRNAGQRVRWIDYEAHVPLARTVFARIGREVGERWPEAELAIHHRTGRVAIGEASVVIAAASAHRADAFAACRFAIERVKQIAPVWKHEYFEGGEVWIEGATADPDDEAALRTAMERACS